MIDIVGYGVARSRDQLKLAAELVLRYAADYAAHSRQQKRRSTGALDLAARFYVTAVPL